jgi:hypothetical protein
MPEPIRPGDTASVEDEVVLDGETTVLVRPLAR